MLGWCQGFFRVSYQDQVAGGVSGRKQRGGRGSICLRSQHGNPLGTQLCATGHLWTDSCMLRVHATTGNSQHTAAAAAACM